jgi:hypothetical protein
MAKDGSIELTTPKLKTSSGRVVEVKIAISKDGKVSIGSKKLKLPKLKLGSVVTVEQNVNGDIIIKSNIPSMNKNEIIRF